MNNDIQPNWLNLIRRIQNIAKKQATGGYSIIKLSVLVDDHGNAQFYSEPKMIKLEPRYSVRKFMEQITIGLTDK